MSAHRLSLQKTAWGGRAESAILTPQRGRGSLCHVVALPAQGGTRGSGSAGSKARRSWSEAGARWLATAALHFSVWRCRMGREARKRVDPLEKEQPDYNLNVLPLLLPARPGNGAKEYSVTDKLWRKTVYWARYHERVLHGSVSRFGQGTITGKVAVLGGGSFGTAMAVHVARKGNSVSLLLRDDIVCDFVNKRHINPKYLSEYNLPKCLQAHIDPAEALADCKVVIHALPVQASRRALESFAEHVPRGVPIVAVSKGLEIGSQRMMCDLISEALQRTHEENPVVVVSGPSFAKEIMDQRPTSVVAASSDLEAATHVQKLLMSSYFRVSTTDDVVGVEVAGALKNVLAIAAGICEGLGLGMNSMSALICQGSAEIRWLATAMGGRPETLAGLSGIGDILLTCYGNLSRNRTLGVRLGRGEPLQDILGSSGGVTEGVFTARLVVELADRHRVLLPVLTSVARILNGEVLPRKAVFEVLSLPPLEESA